MYSNVDSIKNKTFEFHERVDKIKPHIIFVTETKLCPNDPTFKYFITDGYSAYRKDRVTTRPTAAGGVIILVKTFLISEQLDNQDWKELELIVCKLHFGSKTVILGCVYRPPSSSRNYNNKIATAIEQIANLQADQYIICGDFNYSKINWADMVIDESDVTVNSVNDEKTFYDAVQNSFLHQHVDGKY